MTESKEKQNCMAPSTKYFLLNNNLTIGAKELITIFMVRLTSLPVVVIKGGKSSSQFR